MLLIFDMRVQKTKKERDSNWIEIKLDIEKSRSYRCFEWYWWTSVIVLFIKRENEVRLINILLK